VIVRVARVFDISGGVAGLLSWPDSGTRAWRACSTWSPGYGAFFHIEYWKTSIHL